MSTETAAIPATLKQLSACPNCGSADMRPFYEVDDVPCHSVLLMETREQAMSYPRGDIRLVFCESCGFIANSVFDVSMNDYSPQYEETQHFSPRFNQFANQLVADLIERYDIRRRRVLEIGCGKGEFLGLLCEAGDNQGIGIDPGCRPERLPREWTDRIEFIQELYREEHGRLEADVICCRHTLEHIQPTREFLTTIRDSIGDRHDTLVFFEVPDIRIILHQCRFQDIYYEHCSYFSLGSLARLFRACSFDVVDLWRDFGDQYALLVARPTSHPTAPSNELEDDLQELEELVSAFEQQAPATLRRWRGELSDSKSAESRRVAIWGAGSKCVSFLTSTGMSQAVQSVVDINPHKQGRFLPGTGHEVGSPESLVVFQPDCVIAMNPVYLDEIAARLAAMDVSTDLRAL